jgi:pimeloyl-ACP methyl ester carboxylesterase
MLDRAAAHDDPANLLTQDSGSEQTSGRKRDFQAILARTYTAHHPAGFSYRLEDQADALARALDAAGVRDAEVIAHSMGGAVAIALATRRPDLVSRLLVAEAPLDPVPPPAPGSVGVTSYTETEFATGGMALFLEQVDPTWRATMRLGDPVALHRSAFALRAGTTPSARHLLMDLPIPACSWSAAGPCRRQEGRNWRQPGCGW